MITTYQSLRAFVSSPKDVVAERLIAKKVIEEVGATCKEALGIDLECVTWSDLPPQTTKLPDERIQDILNTRIPECHVFILILWRRYGSTEAGHRKSNTQRETEIALDLLKAEKKIMFLTYFRDLPPNEDVGEQERSVRRFRTMLTKEEIWHKRYSKPAEFQELLTHDLYRTILRYKLAPRKHRALRRFWVFGTPDKITHPNLAIIYPSMNRTFMGSPDDPKVWLNRLEPNVVFEDFKALEKLVKTLRLVGTRDFRVYNSSNIPPDVNHMNRFWICLRNTPGLQQAGLYRKVARFTMVRKKIRAASTIRWRRSARSKQSIVIHSPLAKYLRVQRSKLDIRGEWRREMDNIVAKDFAVLARFRDTRRDVAMQDHYLQDYFLAGLRGLGTWGAAWFIDRQYQAFEDLDEKKDFQFLLEVEYRDGRICEVRDVSNKPQRYFDDENNLQVIRRNIEAYRPQ